MELRAKGELARFAYEQKRGRSDWIRQLLPNKCRELSVGRINNLDCVKILALGIEFGKLRTPPKPVHGWIEFSENAIDSHHLTIDHDDNPERHSNILGWPTDTSNQRQICRKLYRACTRVAKFTPAVSEIAKVSAPCTNIDDIKHEPEKKENPQK